MPTPQHPAASRLAATESSGRPLVSVIIPTYNRAPLLKTAISSALNQEQAGNLFDVEVIVVDDCSTENMRPIVAAFPGVRYIRLPVNRGASGARNAGIKEARGKYVALLDDDDEFLDHRKIDQVHRASRHVPGNERNAVGVGLELEILIGHGFLTRAR